MASIVQISRSAEARPIELTGRYQPRHPTARCQRKQLRDFDQACIGLLRLLHGRFPARDAPEASVPGHGEGAEVLAREHVDGHDGAGGATGGASVAAHAEFVERRGLVARKDAADGASACAVPVEQAGRAGRGAGALAARGDGRPCVVNAGRSGDPALDGEGEA